MAADIKPVAWRMKTPHGWVVSKNQHNSLDEPLYPQSAIDSLRNDRDSWAQQASDRVQDWDEMRIRAERAEAEVEKLREALAEIAESADDATTGEGHARCAALARDAIDAAREGQSRE